MWRSPGAQPAVDEAPPLQVARLHWTAHKSALLLLCVGLALLGGLAIPPFANSDFIRDECTPVNSGTEKRYVYFRLRNWGEEAKETLDDIEPHRKQL